MNQPRFLVNFLRDRDFYHVPAALAAHNLLSALITDVYFDAIPQPAREFLFSSVKDHRSPLLPASYARNTYAAALVQFANGKLSRPSNSLTLLGDRLLARATLSYWKRDPSHLLLYSGYATETFRAAQKSEYRRLLFLFHPHYQLIDDVLAADAEQFPEAAPSYRRATELHPERRRIADEELSLSDAVVVASTFSGRSVQRAGVAKPVSVVPYFADLATNDRPYSSRDNSRVRFLFVGQGVQRKGLHHLLRAWKSIQLPNAELTCVCGSLDKELVAGLTEGVTFKSGLSRADLIAEFDASHCFVLPSLVEGFGLVYLEAMARGAFVIGTDNTGLPDIQSSESVGTCLRPGDLLALQASLVDVYDRARRGDLDHSAIAAASREYQFEQYSSLLASTCRSHLSMATR